MLQVGGTERGSSMDMPSLGAGTGDSVEVEFFKVMLIEPWKLGTLSNTADSFAFFADKYLVLVGSFAIVTLLLDVVVNLLFGFVQSRRPFESWRILGVIALHVAGQSLLWFCVS